MCPQRLGDCRIFIGQASGKGAGSGMKQAEQKKVLADFRAGAFNTLVATCIGEEGLDIPQVCQDLLLDCTHHIQYLQHKYSKHKPHVTMSLCVIRHVCSFQ